MDALDEIIRRVRESRLGGDYTVINRRARVVYLSRRDVEFEEDTGQDSKVRKKFEKMGYRVLPYWEQVL